LTRQKVFYNVDLLLNFMESKLLENPPPSHGSKIHRFLNYVKTDVLFMDVAPLLRLSKTKSIEFSDLPPLPVELSTQNHRELGEKIPSDSAKDFIKGIVRDIRKPGLGLMLQGLVNIAFGLGTTGFLYQAIRWFEGSLSTSILVGLGLIAGFSLCSVLRAVNQQLYFYRGLKLVIQLGNSLGASVYKKALRLTQAARAKRLVGDIVNHMSTDVEAVPMGLWICLEIFLAIILVSCVCVALVMLNGLAALAGIAVLFLLTPIASLFIKRFNRHENALLAARDERLTLLSQILHGIRVIKYHALEQKVASDIQNFRTQEIRSRQKLIKSAAISSLLWVGMTTMVSGATFLTLILLGQELSPALIFTTLALFALMEEPINHLSHQIVEVTEGWVSVKRLVSFFRESDLPIENGDWQSYHQAAGLVANDLSCLSPEQGKKLLAQISFTLQPGESLAVIGAIGAGKSVLLQALLGEFPLSTGTLQFTNLAADLKPQIAYVPQQAFVMNASIAENISFGTKVTSIDSYLYATAFTADMMQMQAQGDTEIGEHGVNLSGGQKQRLNLSRALAANPSICLFDDPVSAVDEVTEDHIMDQLIFGLLRDKTRIITTHRLRHLKRFDKVLILNEGKVEFFGSPIDMQEHRFVTLTSESGILSLKNEATNPTSLTQASTGPELPSEEGKRFTSDEDRQTGRVKWQAYHTYLNMIALDSPFRKILTVACLVGLVLLLVSLQPMQRAWLAYWSEGGAEGSISKFFTTLGISRGQDDLSNLWVYVGIGLTVMIIAVSQAYYWRSIGIVAGKNIHNLSLQKVLASPLRFFDTTPIGRILNRFSRDLFQIDAKLIWTLSDTTICIFGVFSTLIAILLFLPWVLVAMIPVSLLFFHLQAKYRRLSREVQRLRSIKSSPRFALFKETLHGLTDIRAFGRQPYFTDLYYEKQDAYQRCFYFEIRLNRWFSIRLPLISALIALAVGIILVTLQHQGSMSPGLAGLLMGYSIAFWESLNWAVRAFAMMENQMVSVERMSHYLHLPSEQESADGRNLSSAAATDWPQKGQISFENVFLRYAADLPLVLHGLNFSVPAGAKVGIFGRTGAGKSSLIAALYRFCELDQGRIVIDGVDISSLPLSQLRRGMAIIPQDPFFFRGSLRQNLDLAGACSDQEIWQALSIMEMDGYVRNLKDGLGAEVLEGGHNFSQGQRQLFCLARAILLKAKIIILDEATASVDVETDRRISQTIRTVFKDTTMLIIAHRHNTFHGCDFVLEMAHGRALHYGRLSPLQDEMPRNSSFDEKFGQPSFKWLDHDSSSIRSDLE
jgi:ABC-type multidrug transport system fused ATPase/permease subunit